MNFWNMFLISVSLAVVTGSACSDTQNSERLVWQERASLPEPVTNNATASINIEGESYIYSFMGLSEGKTYKDIHSKTFKYSLNDDSWSRIEDVPGDSGRLAGTAVAVNEVIYIFGGYTVAEDGSERSVPEVYRLNPRTDTYSLETKMPVPVDDAVAFSYRNRYIYLVSGWHDTGNVNNVQIYDTRKKSWQQATPFPGAPVFGHAGGISGEKILITDGVKVVQQEQGGRTFKMSAESWVGKINPDSPREVSWRQIKSHPGKSRYRMAATGNESAIIFAGGSENPYNYNGIGYNGEPSNPDTEIFSYDFTDSTWNILGKAPVGTMDHRSLIKVGEWYYLAGGMLQGQQVSDKLFQFSPDQRQK